MLPNKARAVFALTPHDTGDLPSDSTSGYDHDGPGEFDHSPRRRIGTAFVHPDHSMTVVLDAMPVSGRLLIARDTDEQQPTRFAHRHFLPALCVAVALALFAFVAAPTVVATAGIGPRSASATSTHSARS